MNDVVALGIAVAYCRVSTKKQEKALKDHQEQWDYIFDQEGYKFANCGIFYKKDGTKELKKGLYIDEGRSAKEYKKHRKAFQQMIEDAMAGKFKQIFVEDTTRFARSIEDGIKIIKDLREKGVNVYFRKEKLNSIDVKNDMVLGVLFSVAQNEIITDSERLKWKQNILHQAGKWTAPAPYGYNVKHGDLSINEEETPIVDLIFYLYTELMLGMRSIANYLNYKKLFRTRKGKLWEPNEIKYILDNRMYIGDIVNHKTTSKDITRGTVEKIPKNEQIVVHNEKLRIIDDETWNKKEMILYQRNKKLENREGHSTKHLLSTLLYCEQCGSVYIRVKKKNAKDETGKKVSRGYEWTCLGHNKYGDIKCKGRYGLAEDELLEFIKEELRKEQEKDNTDFLEIYNEKKKQARDNIDIQKLKEEQEDINMQMFELRRERNKNLINEQTFEQQLQILHNKLEEIRMIESEYNNINIDIERAELRYNERSKLLKNLDFNNLTNAELKQIFNKINVMGEYEDGYKKLYIHFDYNILDDTKTELSREHDDIEHSALVHFKQYKLEKIRKSTKTRYFESK